MPANGTSFALHCCIAPEDDATVETRLLRTLQDLMEFPALELGAAFTAAASHITAALHCDKVDVFVFDQKKQTLRAVGTSDTPMGKRQRAFGLDALPLANGGSIVQVFESGNSYLEGNALRDPDELRGFINELGVRSAIAAPFEVNGIRRGVLSAVSAKTDFFLPRDLQFLEAVARWIGMLARRVEVADQARKVESERARRAAADEIITVLAHDLRNHLNPLLGRLQLMRLHVQSGKDVLASEIDTALRSAKRLSQLTDDLLDLKRLDEGLFNLNPAPVDLTTIAEETAESLTTPSVAVVVSAEEPVVVIADVHRVRQALENLVANAIKYSPPHQKVSITVHCDSSRQRAYGILEIVDRGQGIAADELPTLFERFVRGPTSSGLGLGLYLARHIVRLHDGDLTVESKPGEGTCFRLALPAETAKCQPSEA